MLAPDQFRERVEAFLATHEMKPTRFGVEAVRDPNFVHDLRKGREPRSHVAARVIEFIEAAAPPSTPQQNAGEAA